jgi:flagellar assembly factor FliW
MSETLVSIAEPQAPVPTVVTTRFGTFAVDPTSVIQFPEGLPGFEQNRRFVLISSEEVAPLHVLHAVDGPAASFLAVDPRFVLDTYRTTLAIGDRLKLDADDDMPLVWLVLVATDGDGATVNLRAPIVINPSVMIGCQVMPHNSLYPLRHPLSGD